MVKSSDVSHLADDSKPSENKHFAGMAAEVTEGTSDDTHLADDSKRQENAYGEIPQPENFPISAYEKIQEEVDDPWLPKSQTGARPHTVVVRLVEKFRIFYHPEWRTKLKGAIQGVLREVGHDQSVYVIDTFGKTVHLTVQFGETRRDILEVEAINIRDWETICPANFPLIGYIQKQQRTDMDLGEQSASRTNTGQNTGTTETRTGDQPQGTSPGARTTSQDEVTPTQQKTPTALTTGQVTTAARWRSKGYTSTSTAASTSTYTSTSSSGG